MDCIKVEREMIERIVRDSFSREEIKYKLNGRSELTIGCDGALLDTEEGSFLIYYDSRETKVSEENGLLTLSLVFRGHEDIMEFTFQEVKSGLSYGEIAEFDDGLEKMKANIDEYVENGQLIDDFPVFRERINETLDGMEAIYKANAY